MTPDDGKMLDAQLMSQRRWAYRAKRSPGAPPAHEKALVTATCEKFIAEVLKPRFLPEIRPTKFNYPINLSGNWHGKKYRFIQRFRCNPPDAIEPEFDAPFARIEYISRDRFDVSYHRHTGAWFCLCRSLSLKDALAEIESNPLLHPV